MKAGIFTLPVLFTFISIAIYSGASGQFKEKESESFDLVRRQSNYANQNYELNQYPKYDSIHTGVSEDFLNSLRDENGNKILPGQGSEAMQRKIFNGLSQDEGFGGSINSAGDVNADGFDDIIIGASYYNTYTGRAYIYFGGMSMDTIADLVMTGVSQNTSFGSSVSSAGDVNKDGYSDVIVGASGNAYIFFGGAAMNNSADITMTGETTNDLFGYSVSSAGDVNGDGYSDVFVGAPYGYVSLTGRAYLFYGGAAMDNVPDITLTGEAEFSYFGISVSSAGDVNGDGFSDVIAGANAFNSLTGSAYLFYGGASMNNVSDIVFLGEAESDYFGSSVSTAGDVNGDGYSDVIIGANGNSSFRGKAYIFFGGAIMNNASDVVMTGEEDNYLFGVSVSSAGDVNGDGYSDVIVGAKGYTSVPGWAYIFFGASAMNNLADVTISGEQINISFGKSVSSAGDINRDGYSDVIVSSDVSVYLFDYFMKGEIISDLILNGESTNNYFGYYASSAGDVNADGYSDVIVGAYSHNSETGRAYIFFGGESMNNIADVTMTGETASSRFGVMVSSAGDVNHDGFSDVIVGAEGYSSNRGRAYIFFGGSPMNSSADVTLTGETAGSLFGFAVSSAGDINNDTCSDVIVSAYNYSSATGRAYIFLGGSNMNNTSDITLTGETSNSNFGSSLSFSDINRDGYSDVVVGANRYNSWRGRAYVFLGGQLMNSTADVIMTGESANSQFGISVFMNGDVNGDNYPDVIVGAREFNSFTGKVYVYYGGDSLNNIQDVTINGESINNQFGASVSACDVNKDGYSDVIVSAYGYNSSKGKVYVYFGGTAINNVADVTMGGEAAGNFFGYPVSNAGDVNGDSYEDLVAGASRYNGNTGRAYIFLSSAIASKFKSAASGNWNSVSTWQMSTDGINWIPATRIPNASSGTITIQNSHQVSLTSNDSADQIFIESGGNLIIDTMTSLIVKGVRGSGLTLNSGIISGKGSLIINGAAGLSVLNNSVFNVNCKIKSGVTVCTENPAFAFNKELSIDAGAVFKIQAANSSVKANHNVINNGTISGGGTFIANGLLFVNNGLVTNPNLSFNDTTLLSGNGNIASVNFNILPGAFVTVVSNLQLVNLSISSGAKLDISSRTIKLSNSGTPLVNNGSLITANSTIEYNGITPQTISASTFNFANLKINNPAGVTLQSGDSIPGLLHILNGDLNLNGDTITLLDTARIFETQGNTVTGNGSIRITKNINNPNFLDVGGLGLVITSSANFGQTTVKRTWSSQNVAPGKPSIKRCYDISPFNNTALNANIIFRYDNSELDTLREHKLELYRSTNNGITFTPEGGSVDTITNRIFLNHVQSFSRWTAARDSIEGSFQILDSVYAGNLYSKGKFPIKWGSYDTISVKLKRPASSTNNDTVKLNYLIQKRDSFTIVLDSTITIPEFQFLDTLTIHLPVPLIRKLGPYSVIVQALPDELGPINGYEIQTYCFDVTCDAFSYTEPCDTIDGGAGFTGSRGRMIAGFNNLNSTEIFPIHAIDHSFVDAGPGNIPYRLAIYSAKANGKPDTAIYTSQQLYTPAGNGTVKKLTHIVYPPVNIPPNRKFYVGYVQTSTANIKASFQNENPVRSGTFFFSNSDTNNVWFDFADSSKNFRIDISPKATKDLKLSALLEGFYNNATNKLKEDTVKIEVHNFNSPYNPVDTAKVRLDSLGTGVLKFTKIDDVSEYYFVLRHRNHIETWSYNYPQKFDDCDKQYNFMENISKAFGDNMKQVDAAPLCYAVYGGDVNQDGCVDLTDNQLIDNDSYNYALGYLNTDLNGDNSVDLSDAAIGDNNAFNYVCFIKP